MRLRRRRLGPSGPWSLRHGRPCSIAARRAVAFSFFEGEKFDAELFRPPLAWRTFTHKKLLGEWHSRLRASLSFHFHRVCHCDKQHPKNAASCGWSINGIVGDCIHHLADRRAMALRPTAHGPYRTKILGKGRSDIGGIFLAISWTAVFLGDVNSPIACLLRWMAKRPSASFKCSGLEPQRLWQCYFSSASLNTLHLSSLNR